LLQKKYPIKSLRSPEINFSNGYDFFQMYNVESSDGYTLMVNVYDGRVLFLDENFEIFKEYTWGSGELKGEKVPLEYIYVMNKWLSS
ncbi:hypothetical protein NK983_30505, partial [Salmonella enterica subsp. enterica serovar Typhimurium]|nr:hypothetical protein [Salmonella enterica subsp. enterica serovar Typhimurium]